MRAGQPRSEFGELVKGFVPALLTLGEHLTGAEDAFEAERAAAETLVPMLALDDFRAEMARSLAEGLAAEGGPAALAVLRMLAEFGEGADSDAASGLADGMAASGVADPPWLETLRAPVEALEFRRFSAASEPERAALVASFRRAGVDHGFLVAVDYLRCGAADLVEPVRPGELGEVVSLIGARYAEAGIDPAEEVLDPETAGRFLVGAVQASLDHMAEDGSPCGIGPDADPDSGAVLDRERARGLGALLTRRLRAAGLAGEAPKHGEHVPGGGESPNSP